MEIRNELTYLLKVIPSSRLNTLRIRDKLILHSNVSLYIQR